jgi:hypothetical protein
VAIVVPIEKFDEEEEEDEYDNVGMVRVVHA